MEVLQLGPPLPLWGWEEEVSAESAISVIALANELVC